ncbi:T9SS type A sorting domain-containing protein [Stygiobacter electus]|uniref:T9SS type A sorting domain-containing protein n=1 Tax=Stygiobacter electus TaxID=3032292 RepID=A0AAE3NXM1_9BACT|nr:T9SS type A sorting domain-containing protein [Stygiobacter electus]MDF1612836.1 T9SS type A sorting domain-containing protein [Stygiobacter electus]
MKKAIILFAILLATTQKGYAQLNSAFTISGGMQYGSTLGAKAVPVHISWRQVQRYYISSYDWSSVDSFIRAAQSAGLEPWIVLRCTNPISASDTIPGTCAYIYDHSSGTTDNLSSWFPEDTVKWKLFLDALVERYDGNGISDMPGLTLPVSKWHIGQEWPRIWCSQFDKNSLQFAEEFVRYEVMTYNEIKKRQTNSIISFAGLTNHKVNTFYDGYYNQSTYCLSGDCNTQNNLTREMLSSIPEFLSSRTITLYLLQNAKYDVLDVHQYGEWQHIPDVVKWCKDHAVSRSIPVVFFEGGGPFCKSCENIYHPASETKGTLPPELVRDNASYVVYYFISGLASGVKRLNWNVSPEYSAWGSIWGDLDLLSINYVPKPSFYTYRFLSKYVFASEQADSVVRVAESNPSLYHYRIKPLGMEVIWSTNSKDSFVLNGNGKLYLYHIPTVMGDTVVVEDTLVISGSYNMQLRDGVPIFFQWASTTGIDDRNILRVPLFFELSQNFPNPFNPSTVISYQLPVESYVKLKVYNVLGREVRTLVDGELSEGEHSIIFDSKDLPSGVYFYQLKTNNFVKQRKMVIIK